MSDSDVDPDFDSDCVVHGVATWSVHGGHDVVHYCTDACRPDCIVSGEETGEWCSGPLEMRTRADELADEPDSFAHYDMEVANALLDLTGCATIGGCGECQACTNRPDTKEEREYCHDDL